MRLSKLGDYIELVDNRNSDGKYTADDVRGISTSKVFIETKANLDGVSLTNYKVVNIHEFAYVADTSRRGEKIGLAYADTKPCIISSIYTVFRVKENAPLLSRYLMMFFSRSEFDRYSRFNSWGSARETFNWDDFCDIELEVPSIEIQRKYVAIYEGMLANLRSYEKGLEDLKLVCDGYIEDLRRSKKQKLEGMLVESDERNTNQIATLEKGVSIQKVLIDTKAQSSDITKQKVVRKGYFAFNSNTSRNSDTISIALNRDEPCAVSNTYIVFSCKDCLIPEYLYLWFKRKEFDRFARFNSWGSARETISLKEIEQAEIAIPSIATQRNIVNVLSSYDKRVLYLNSLKQKISSICPILIRGSILEAQGGK